MHVLYIELSMRLLFCEVAPVEPGMGALQFGIRALQFERVLQFGIRAKVLTLSLDGPVEWSLDQGFEEELCLEDQFRTFECS
jgi:hypothetical protein